MNINYNDNLFGLIVYILSNKTIAIEFKLIILRY